MAITVNISTKDLTGTALATTLRFNPLSFPSVLGTALLAGPHKDVDTDADGIAEVELEAGDYKVSIGAGKPGSPLYVFTIQVDTDTPDPSDLVDLIVESVLSNDGFNFVISGGTLYLKNPTTNKYHKPYALTLNGIPVVALDAGISISGPDKGPVSRKGNNYRFKNGNTLQLLNVTTLEYHTMNATGTPPQISLGPGEA